MPAVSDNLPRAHLSSSSRTAPTPFRLLSYLACTIPHRLLYCLLKLRAHPHPYFSSSASRLSPAATIRSSLRKQLLPAFLPCRPPRKMCIRAPSLVVQVASRRKFLPRCRAVGVPSTSWDVTFVVYASVDRVFQMPSYTSFVLCTFGIIVSVFGLFLLSRFFHDRNWNRDRDRAQRIDERRRHRLGVLVPNSADHPTLRSHLRLR